MPVFDADVLTKSLPTSLQESATNHLLLGQGEVEHVAMKSFLSRAGMEAGAEQHLTGGDESIFVDEGLVTLNVSKNLFDYTYGSVHSITMGTTTTTVNGKERSWYRGVPDGETAHSTFYTGADVVQGSSPGYDQGENDASGASKLEARSVFNETLAEYQWAGLTQVRLVDDHIQYGEPQTQIETINFQYGNLSSRVKGDDSLIRVGNVTEEFQGDRTRTYNSASHTAVTVGMSSVTRVGHEGSSTTTQRAKDAEDAFTSQRDTVLGNVQPPDGVQKPQWNDLYKAATQRLPMSFENYEGAHLLLNLNADFTFALMRNAMGLIGATGRIFGIDVKAGEAACKTLLLLPVMLVTGVTALSVRVGSLFLGMLRAGPPAANEEIEMQPIGAAAAAAPAVEDAAPLIVRAVEVATPAAAGAAVRAANLALRAAEESAEAFTTAEGRAGAALQEVQTAAERSQEMARVAELGESTEEDALNEEIAESELAEAMGRWEAESDAAVESGSQAVQAEEAAKEAVTKAEEAAAKAALLRQAQQSAVGAAWGFLGVAGLGALLGGPLAGAGSGEHLPDSSLGSPEIGGESDNASAGGFEGPTSSYEPQTNQTRS